MLDTVLYTPLPGRKQAPVACDYTLVFADDPGGAVFCSFTRSRCGPHNCPLNKFANQPGALSSVPQTAYFPHLFAAV